MKRIFGGRHALLGAAIVFVAALAVFAVLILAEDDPPAIAEAELPAGCQSGLPYITCTYTSSTKISFDSIASQLESVAERQFGSSTPVWIQAWGGRGAKGASWEGYSGAYGGYGGYAITVQSVGALSGDTLYLYVGANGSKHANYSGQGGASTIVSTQLLSQSNPFAGVLAVAGGSGGGGKAGNQCYAGRGGSGGVAIAGTGAANGAGAYGNGKTRGGGGSGGSGGSGGGSAGNPGTNGLGGYGGPGNYKGSPAGWMEVAAVDPAAAGWNAGAGGEGRGGGGGGGYGGGGGGGECAWVASLENDMNGGGGGGASYARANAVSDSRAPTDSKQGDGVSSKVVLTIDVS